MVLSFNRVVGTGVWQQILKQTTGKYCVLAYRASFLILFVCLFRDGTTHSGLYPLHQLAIKKMSHRHTYIDTDHYNVGSSVGSIDTDHCNVGSSIGSFLSSYMGLGL